MTPRHSRGSEASREVPLIKLGTFRDDKLLGSGVVEPPALVARSMAKIDALFHVRLKSLPLVPLHMHIGSAPKYPNIAQIRFLLVPGLIGRLARQGGGREAVANLDLRPKSPIPEGWRQTSFKEHGCNVLCQCPVGSLCISILLGPIPRGMAPLNATFIGETNECSRHVLPSLVIMHGLHLDPQTVLSPCLECPKRLKRVAFAF
jgi:hypothetical protein